MHTAEEGDVNKPVLTRNLTTIFKGPRESISDSSQIIARKRRRVEKCKAIRRMAPGAILAWAASLPSRTWEDIAMDVFYSLAEQMANERPLGAGLYD